MKKLGAKKNPPQVEVNIYSRIHTSTLRGAESKAAEDGVPYLNSLTNLLLSMYSRGRVSSLAQSAMRNAMRDDKGAEPAGPSRTVHLKLSRVIVDKAKSRLMTEARSWFGPAGPTVFDGSYASMARLMFHLYATGKVEIKMVSGRERE